MRPSRLPGRSPDKAFESLYRRHFREIFGYAVALLRSPADAEDATQATFLNAYRALERGERPRNAASWLRAIALNVCREHFRRASRRPDEVSLEHDPGELVVEAPGPAMGDVIRALSHLPFNQRAALVMREFEGRSLAEIATLLEVTSSAVETLLFRARRALREQLEGSLRCDEAERAISRQLDDALSRSERGALRAHLRECPECASLARRLRAQGSALKSLALVPAPATLAWSKLALPGVAGGGSTAAGAAVVTAGAGPVAVKVVGATALAALAVGAGYAGLGHHGRRAARSGAGDAAPHAITSRSLASTASGGAVARSALQRTTLARGRGRSIRATQQKTGARAARSRTAEHSAPGTSTNGRIPASRQSGAHQTAAGAGVGPGTSTSHHGHGHAYGHSARNGHTGAGTATSQPHPPTTPSPGHRQPPGNGRGQGLANGHSGGNGHTGTGAATNKPHPPTGPPPGHRQPPGNGRGQGLANGHPGGNGNGRATAAISQPRLATGGPPGRGETH